MIIMIMIIKGKIQCGKIKRRNLREKTLKKKKNNNNKMRRMYAVLNVVHLFKFLLPEQKRICMKADAFQLDNRYQKKRQERNKERIGRSKTPLGFKTN